MNRTRCWLMALLCLLLLVLFARAVPSGPILEDAQMRYVEDRSDHEYDFL